MDLISVIVPVYNVERYLDRCISSILCQSYPELEILLVDDGSTDRSGLLCDEWERRDPRIRVIRKTNGGLADARNAGLDAAAGEYVVFVDSDDYIAADMIRNLYDALKKHRAEMSICNFFYVDENGSEISERNQDLPIRDECISGSEAIKRMSTPNRKGWYYITAWNKLYSAKLFREIRFPIRKLHEDEFVAHRLLSECERIACMQTVGYYYVQRPGSIMHSKKQKSRLHAAEAYLDRAVFCAKQNDLHRCAGQACLKAAIALSDAVKGSEAYEVRDELKHTLQQLRQYRWLRRYCTWKEKLQITIIALSPIIYSVIFRNNKRQQIKHRKP